MTSRKPKKFISVLVVLTMIVTLLPATVGMASSYTTIEEFVRSLYTVGLERQPEVDGYNYWVNELKNGRPAAEAVGFILLEAPEFKEKYANISNEEFIEKAYQIIFGRQADVAGKKFFLDLMNRGASQRFVIVSMLYAESGEFQEFCDNVGIKLGSIEVAPEDHPGDEPVVLEVVDVSANNLKEVFVKFNKNVEDEQEVAKVGNYSLNVGDLKSVRVNGDTAILTLKDHVENQKKAVLTVNDKILEKKTKFNFTFFDASLPEVVDLTVTGPKSFVIEFSEPIDLDGGDKIVQVKTSSSTLSVSKKYEHESDENKVRVDLYSSLVDGREYTITIKGFEDYAGYDNIIETITLNYEKDDVPPVATVEKATQEYVVVNFSKPVKGLTPKHFYHTFTAWTAVKLTKNENREDVIEKDTSVSKVYVWFYTADEKEDSHPIPEGLTSLTIRGKVDNYEIKDNWDNKFATTTYGIYVEADKTSPEVKNVTVVSEQSIKIEFTKTVKFTKDNIEILDTKGEKIDGLNISISPDIDNDKDPSNNYNVDFGKNLAGKTIIVTIKDVMDTSLHENRMEIYTTEIEMTDKTPPEVSDVTYSIGDNGVATAIYVFYNEAVDAETALNAGNYYLYNDGEFTKLTSKPSFYNNDKIVKIPLTKSQGTEAVKKGCSLFVTSVKDLAGNEIKAKVWESLKSEEENAPEISTVKAIAKDTIVVEFNQELRKVDLDDFELIGVNLDEAEGEEAFSSMDVSLKNGVTMVTLNLTDEAKKKIPYNVNVNVDVDEDKVKIKLKEGTIENLFGVTIDVALIEEVQDYIAPVKEKISLSDERERVIEVEFSEPLDGQYAHLYAYDIVVARSDGAVLLAGIDYTTKMKHDDEKVVLIELEPNCKAGTYKIYSKDSITYIKDKRNNKAKAFTKPTNVTIE